MNAARTEEQSLIQAALKVMQGSAIQAYRHAGVELSRVPGGEKLRVRLVKEQDDAEVSSGAGSPVDDDTAAASAANAEAAAEA